MTLTVLMDEKFLVLLTITFYLLYLTSYFFHHYHQHVFTMLYSPTTIYNNITATLCAYGLFPLCSGKIASKPKLFHQPSTKFKFIYYSPNQRSPIYLRESARPPGKVEKFNYNYKRLRPFQITFLLLLLSSTMAKGKLASTEADKENVAVRPTRANPTGTLKIPAEIANKRSSRSATSTAATPELLAKSAATMDVDNKGKRDNDEGDDDFNAKETDWSSVKSKKAKRNEAKAKKSTTGKKDSDRSAHRVSVGGNDKATTTTTEVNVKRQYIVYTTMVVSPPKTKAAQRIETYIEMLKFIIKMVQTIDEDIIIYKYDDTEATAITESMALFGGSSTAFPATLMTMKTFFAGLHVRDSPKLYLNLRIGTDKDATDIVRSGNELLQEALDKDNKFSCNANWYTKHLQVPYAEDAGWIVGLFHNCDTCDFQELLGDHLDELHEEGQLKVSLPISVRIKAVRQQATNNKKKDTDKQNDSTNRAFHVEVPRGMKKTASRWVHFTLKHAKAFQTRSNLPLTWVPAVDKDSSPQEVTYSKKALAHHKSIFASAEFSYVSAIQDLDIRSDRLDKKSLREILMEIPLLSDPTTKAFILAEKAYNGDAILYYAKKWAEEARTIIKYLILLISRMYPKAGSAIEQGFTYEAIEEATDYYWDEDNNRPASKTTQELEETLESAKKKTAGWIFDNIELVNNNNTDNAVPRPSGKSVAWETGTFGSHMRQDASSEAAETAAASPSAVDASTVGSGSRSVPQAG